MATTFVNQLGILFLFACLVAGQTAAHKTVPAAPKEPPAQRLSGVLREGGDESLTIETADKGVIRVRTNDKTKFFREDKEARALFLKPGDFVDVKVVPDSDGGLLVALEVRLQPSKHKEVPAATSPPRAAKQPTKQDDDFEPPRLARGRPTAAPHRPETRQETETRTL